MIRLLRPKAFVPVHGTHHHRSRHLELATEEGIAQTQLVENGNVLEVTKDTLGIVDTVPTGRVYIDGMRALSAEVIAERRAMGSAGLVTVLLSLKGGRLRELPRCCRGVFWTARNDSASSERSPSTSGIGSKGSVSQAPRRPKKPQLRPPGGSWSTITGDVR